MPKKRFYLICGTLDLLVLQATRLEPRQGLGIADRIHQIPETVPRVEQASLYRLQTQRLIKAEADISESNQKARFYRHTTAGHSQLGAETARWSRLAAAINPVIAEA